MPLRLDDIRAWIEVDGRELPSYFTKTFDKRGRAECFVPSEEGKAFSICWQNMHRATDTGTRLVVDGVQVKGTRLRSFSRKPGSGDRVDMQRQSGVQTSVRTERAFVFARPDSGSSSSSASSSGGGYWSNDDEKGTITMIVSELSNPTEEPLRSPTTDLPSPPPHLFLGPHTKNKHIVQLGETREIISSAYKQKCHRLRDIATFVFRYRPLEFLREMEHYLCTPAYNIPMPHMPAEPPSYDPPQRWNSNRSWRRRFSTSSRWSGRSSESGASSIENTPREERKGGRSRTMSVLVKKRRSAPPTN